MREKSTALRYWLSAVALSCALSLVSFAQVTSGAQPAKPADPPKEWPKDRVGGLIAEWTRAKNWTKEYLDKMPEDGLNFKPVPEIRSFAEQMLHLANANFNYGVRGTGATNPYQGKNLEKMDDFKANKAALTKAVMDSYDFMIGCVKGMNMAKAGEPLKLFNRFDTTRIGAIAAAFEHQTHHRGQTTVYIRMKGVKPPQERLF